MNKTSTHNIFIAGVVTVFLLIPVVSFAQASSGVNDSVSVDQSGNATTNSTGNTTSTTVNPDGTVSFSSTPYNFQRQGIFGCNSTGANAQSIGAQGAQAGAYVPVADATTELNTGILVYKECVLREVVDRERESATSALLKQLVNAALTGRGGSPQFVQNQGTELLAVQDKTVVNNVQNNMSVVNPAYKSPVQTAVVRNYYSQTRTPNAALVCGYSGDPSADSSLTGISAGLNPACTRLGAYLIGSDVLAQQVAQATQYQQNMWNWANGFYSVTDANGNIVTPGYFVGQNILQGEQSGFNQLQNANDIGQMVGALFAGLSTQAVASSQGLAGLTQSAAGQPSYLDQLSAESAEGLQQAAVNVALQNLAPAQQIEQQYNQIVNAIAANLTQTIAQLRGAENQCWNLIIQHVCSATSTSATAGNTCTDQNGSTLHIATSTVASQTIINTQIAPLASSTITQLNNSNKALQLIQQLISSVTNTTSLDAQRIALEQLDQLVAQHLLHSPADVQNISQQQSSITSQTQTLVTTTVQAWADSTDPSVGWCNVNNPTVIQQWDQKWQ